MEKIQIRDPGWKNSDPPGSWIEKIQILDEKNSDPGSEINIPDPQHWLESQLW
jgi:hypothetical protein